MASFIWFCRSGLEYTYNTVAAVATFNHKIVSSMFRITTNCYQASVVVVKGIGSATGETFFYIGDFLIEALNVVAVCLSFLGKFLVLIYHITTSLITGLLLALEFFGSLIAQTIVFIAQELHSVSKSLGMLWTTSGFDVSKASSEAGDLIYTNSTNAFALVRTGFLTFLTTSVKVLNYAGDIINSYALNVIYNIYFIGAHMINGIFSLTNEIISKIMLSVVYLLHGMHASCTYVGEQIWSTVDKCYTNRLTSLFYVCMRPFYVVGRRLKKECHALCDWLGQRLISNEVYIYVLVGTVVVVIIKVLMEQKTRRSLFNYANITRRRHWRHNHRREQARINFSSDEDDETGDGIDDYDLRRETNAHRRNMDNTDTSSSNSDSDGETTDTDTDGADDETNVEEFEIDTDTESEAESEPQIQIELPNPNERYNLRTRFSPFPHSSNPKQLKEHLETERDKRLCVVCVDQVKNVLVLPCRHMCLCVDCAHKIVDLRMRSRRVCPLCRCQIQTVMNVFT